MRNWFGFLLIAVFATVLVGPSIGCKQPPAEQALSATPAPTQGQIDDARTIATALEGYAVDHGGYPVATSIADLKAALEPEYVASLPTGDTTGEYKVRVTSDSYEIRNAAGALLISR